jgi:hypothetical protein
MLLFSVQGRRTALMFAAPSPSMSHRKTISRSLVFSFLFSVCAFAQTPPDSDARHHPTQPAPAPTDHEQILAYWTTETGWHSELQLRNNQMSGDLIVTPALRTTNGVETKLSPVTVKPQEVKAVDLDAAIGTSAPQLVGTYGSLVLRYHSRGYRNLYAALMVRNIGHPFAFHIDASGESEGYQGGSREGVWWLPKDTTNDYLILTNQGNDTVPVDLSLYDASGKEVEQKVTLGPRETTRYSVRKLILAGGLVGTYGGIKVSAAHAGSLDTLHFLFDETAGFSAILKMFDHVPNAKVAERDYAQTAVWTLRAPMLALSNPDPALAFPPTTTLRPQLFIRNTTDKAVDAALRFNWRSGSGTGKASGPALLLNPYETRRIDVAALQDGSVLPKQANWASVTLTTNGQPDEVMAVAASYDDTLRFGAQTPFSDQLTFKWEGGMWEFDPQHNSIITAGNGGTKPTQTAFTIYYNQGTERYDLEQTLQPDEQMWIDVGKLIREHVQDKNGKRLPDNLTSGSYEFRDLTDKAVGSLFEGKVIYDKTYGHVAYGCATCCSYSRWTENYNPMLLTVGNSAQNGVSAYELCFNGFTDVSTRFYNGWNTSNHAIATVVAAFGTGGTTTAVGVGTTAENTSGLLQTGQQRNCPSFLVGVNGSTIVAPSISGPNTLWWFNGLGAGVSGYANQITLTASSGGTGTSYQWAITAGSDKVSLSTGTSATVQVTSIGQSRNPNDVSITVTVGGITSNPFNLSVRAPYTLGVDPAHTTPVYEQDQEYVWHIFIYNQIFDNLLTPMPNPVPVNEHWTTGPIPDPAYPNETWPQGAEGCGTTPSYAPAEVWDFIQGAFIGNYPPPVYNTQQNGPAVYSWGDEIRVGTCTFGAGPRVQTNTLQKYTDHAAHTGITTPAP